MADLDNIREVLHALSEARDGVLYSLFVDLTHLIRQPVPKIEFRIFRMSDSDEVAITVGVSGIRSDGTEVCWSLTMETRAGSLVITGCIEISVDGGYHEVFVRSGSTTD